MPNEAQIGESPRPIWLLLSNREKMLQRFNLEGVSHTPPSPEHYPHIFLWDSCFSAIVFARYGYVQEAATELLTLVKGQQANGLIPNMQFFPKGRKFDPERPSFMHPKDRSDYTQPPVLALAVQETYKALLVKGDKSGAQSFLERIYPNLKSFYNYFIDNRQNGADNILIGNIHPHETGRDSDPTFDFIKTRLQRKGDQTSRLTNNVNRVLDYGSVLKLNYQLRAKQWNLEEAKKLFWVNDVMFNCIYVDNLYQMAELATNNNQAKDAVLFSQKAQQVEKQILTQMWFPEQRTGKGTFLALNHNKPIDVVSVSNLFPLILPNLHPEQLDSILELLETSFNTPYPIPSVPHDNSNYDPHHGERDRLWRGPTWINMNWYLVERGLRVQAMRKEIQNDPNLASRCQQLATYIAQKSHELVEQGYYEYYDPENGTPERGNKTKNFAWSTLADIL